MAHTGSQPAIFLGLNQARSATFPEVLKGADRSGRCVSHVRPSGLQDLS